MNRKQFENIFSNLSGSVATEFAFILPLFLLLIFPTIDFARYILLQEIVIKTAYSNADAVSMSRPVEPGTTTQADIDQDGTYLTQEFLQELVGLTGILMRPFPPEVNIGQDSHDLYNVQITHIRNKPSANVLSPTAYNPVMDWIISQNVPIVQFPPDIPVTLPVGLAGNLEADENLIRVRVTAVYNPITPPLVDLGIPFLNPGTLEHTAYFRSRYGDLRYVWVNGGPMPNPAPSPSPAPNT